MVPASTPDDTSRPGGGSSPREPSLGAARLPLTVVVNAYRRRQYLRQAVQSVLDQTADRGDYEIVVVKDFSDAELDGWLAAQRPRVRVVTEDLPGVGAGLARGVELAAGEVVAFLEDDDRFHPEKLQRVHDLFRADPALGFVRNAYDAIDAQGNPVPSWEQLRPVPPADRTIDPRRAARGDLPWVFAYAPNVNVSSMSIRTALLRSGLDRLRRTAGAPDSLLFALAAGSGQRIHVAAGRWNDYRVHPSLSHASLDPRNPSGDLTDLVRSRATAELMPGLLTDASASAFARRFVTSFHLEVLVTIFLLDPTARFSFREWLTFGRSILWRRQRYLFVPWGYCLFRWLFPQRAVRSYRARRSAHLRTVAGSTAPR
jgi:glycosyltransferase involved in cell wall biosynthesis